MVDPATAVALPVERIWALCDDLVVAHSNYLTPGLRTLLRP
jgi:alpha-galactosidase